MISEWRYALKPLPVDSAAKKLAATMRLLKQAEAFQREHRALSVAEASTEERMSRIVRGLRARVAEPELQGQGRGPDDDPSKRN